MDTIVDNFKNVWKELGIDYDYFIRTTDEAHKKEVQDFFETQLTEVPYTFNYDTTPKFSGFMSKKLLKESYDKNVNNIAQLLIESERISDNDLSKLSENFYFYLINAIDTAISKFIENVDIDNDEFRKNMRIQMIKAVKSDI